MTNQELHLKLLKLQQQGLQILSANNYGSQYGNYQQYAQWMSSVHLFSDRHLQNHPMKDELDQAYFFKNDYQRGFIAMLSVIDVIGKDTEFWQELNPQATELTVASVPLQNSRTFAHSNPHGSGMPNAQPARQAATEKELPKVVNGEVFIVHGHDNAAKQEMARTLEKIGLKAIILHEQPDSGKTIIEKIETYTDVPFAVVLYTECDVGRAKEDDVNHEHYRARQNVVFEHGYLIGKLGRDKVCAFVKGEVETPGDITGVVYTKMDENGAWQLKLVQNLKAAGLEVDANKLM